MPEPPERDLSDPQLDPRCFAAAFKQLRSRLEALPRKALVTSTTDRQRAAIAAAAVARFVMQPEVRARFEALPAGELDPAYITDLEVAAQACWHATIMLATAKASRQGALPDALLQRAAALKGRMLKLASYHLDEHPQAGPEIAAIRPGTSHIDLATDLARLAKLYATHEAVVKTDTRHYRPSDQHDAEQLATEIIQQLGDTPNGAEQLWRDRTKRAFTLLLHIYNEIAATGRWLFRHDDLHRRFPSLYTAGRAPRKRRTPKKQPPADTSEASNTTE